MQVVLVRNIYGEGIDMASEMLNSKTSVKDVQMVSAISNAIAVNPSSALVVFMPNETVKSENKVVSAVKKILKSVDDYPAEIFLGVSIAACMAVVTGGAALPVIAVADVAVALW